MAAALQSRAYPFLPTLRFSSYRLSSVRSTSSTLHQRLFTFPSPAKILPAGFASARSGRAGFMSSGSGELRRGALAATGRPKGIVFDAERRINSKSSPPAPVMHAARARGSRSHLEPHRVRHPRPPYPEETACTVLSAERLRDPLSGPNCSDGTLSVSLFFSPLLPRNRSYRSLSFPPSSPFSLRCTLFPCSSELSLRSLHRAPPVSLSAAVSRSSTAAGKVDCTEDYPRCTLTLSLPVYREILFHRALH